MGYWRWASSTAGGIHVIRRTPLHPLPDRERRPAFLYRALRYRATLCTQPTSSSDSSLETSFPPRVKGSSPTHDPLRVISRLREYPHRGRHCSWPARRSPRSTPREPPTPPNEISMTFVSWVLPPSVLPPLGATTTPVYAASLIAALHPTVSVTSAAGGRYQQSLIRVQPGA